ncbi:MAG: CarD family transcriptional regulator [Eubacterium sp.]|nr:CarD family transcriptional regulator [Eubacterium sp.]
MYKKGTYIVYGMSGPCLVEDITRLSIPGCDRKRKYYVLRPVITDKSTIYSPVDNEKVVIRDLMCRDEAEELIMQISDIPEIIVENEKVREEQYKEIIKQINLRQCIALLKTLLHKKKERQEEGRKFTTVDERYLKETEIIVSSELALALGEERSVTDRKIRELITAV